MNPIESWWRCCVADCPRVPTGDPDWPSGWLASYQPGRRPKYWCPDHRIEVVR